MKLSTKLFLFILLAFAMTASTCRRGGRGGDGAGDPVDWEMLPPMEDVIPLPPGRGEIFETGTPVAHAIDAVYFAFDSYRVSPGEMFKIQMAADHLRSNPNDVVVVEGHTDERGSREYNLALGERRALAVRESLVGLGISSERIQTLSFGQESPAAMGSGEAIWSLNRRAVFNILR